MAVSNITEIAARDRNTGYIRQWKVESESTPGTFYTVSLDASLVFSCSCIGWTRHTPRKDCKHIQAILDTKIKGDPLGVRHTNSNANISIPFQSNNTADIQVRVTEMVVTDLDKPLGITRRWTVRIRFPAIVTLTGEKLICHSCKKQPCGHTSYLTRYLGMEKNSLEHEVKNESATDHWFLSLEGLPACQCNGTVMEAGYGCFRCRGCGFTISEEDYYEKLHTSKTVEVNIPSKHSNSESMREHCKGCSYYKHGCDGNAPDEECDKLIERSVL